MAEENGKRNRKANFTPQECSVIFEEAEKHMDVIKSKFSTVITNKKKNLVWSEITNKVNSLGACERTVTEVKDKWRSMVSNAKKEHCNIKKSKKVTGGGPPDKPLNPSSTKIIELFGDDPSFSGIGGGVDSSAPLPLAVPNPLTDASCLSTIDLSEFELLKDQDDAEVIDVTEPLPLPKKEFKIEGAKRRKITSDDINQAHLEVIQLEKEKLHKEIANADLQKEKLLLEIEEVKLRSRRLDMMMHDDM